jgi:hypothetical protein
VHNRQLARLKDEQLLDCYGLRALALDEGRPPVAVKVQYFVECWRELRRRKRTI